MAIINGITVTELRNDFEEGVRPGQGPHARKSFLVDKWTDRFAVANGLLGFVQSAPGSVGGSFSLSQPATYPDSPNLFAREVTIRGIGKVSDGPAQVAFEKAIVSAHYGVYVGARSADPAALHSFDPAQPIVYATQEFDVHVEYIRMHPACLQLDDGTRIQDYYNWRTPIANLTVTLNKVPYLPTQAILNNVGKINDATFLGAAAYHLMFNGARSRAGAYTDGTYTQDLSLSFSFRGRLRWDYVPKPGGSELQFKQLQYVTTGTAVVQAADLSTLIPNWYYQ